MKLYSTTLYKEQWHFFNQLQKFRLPCTAFPAKVRPRWGKTPRPDRKRPEECGCLGAMENKHSFYLTEEAILIGRNGLNMP